MAARFSRLVVAVLRNPEKDPLFSVTERRQMLESMTAGFDNVSIDTFHGLTVDYALRVDAQAILRGIRAISDYEYELQMALMNRKLQPGLETVFMMPAEKYSYLSSRLVREVAQLGGAIDCMVPPLVAQKLREKIDVAHKFDDGEDALQESEIKMTERMTPESVTSERVTSERKTKSRKRKS